MKRVIVFFNMEPARVVQVMRGITTIHKRYPDGADAHLPIMSAGFPSLTGDARIVHVAADRTLSSDEILAAAEKFL